MKFIRKNSDILILIILIVIVIILIMSRVEVSSTYSDTTIIGDSRMVGLCMNSWYQKDKGTCIAKYCSQFRC